MNCYREQVLPDKVDFILQQMHSQGGVRFFQCTVERPVQFCQVDYPSWRIFSTKVQVKYILLTASPIHRLSQVGGALFDGQRQLVQVGQFSGHGSGKLTVANVFRFKSSALKKF